MFAVRYFHTVSGITILPDTKELIHDNEVDYLLKHEIADEWDNENEDAHFEEN